MLKLFTLGGTLAVLATAAASAAGPVTNPQAPYVNYAVVFSEPEVAPANSPSRDFVAEIVTWLSGNFNLPATTEHPRIELATQAKIVALRHRGLLANGKAWVQSADALLEEAKSTVALYDDMSRTIYLPENWKGSSPAERSVLVHEMVHHLQNLAAIKYECPQAREKVAYVAQERWLAQFGLGLTDAVDIDPMLLLVLTNCMD